ncbi:MAG: 50S ribosomal protein L11 methyltransferase, partial [Paludibacteraceae bacterium]|nr:50S ribosomal protein L11 methyltransferase [Paludibacteraceae bacterium]
FDFIIANINRNILLRDMPYYVKSLNKKGSLLMSGFYSEDIPMIEAEANRLGLKKISVKEKNNWVAVLFKDEK